MEVVAEPVQMRQSTREVLIQAMTLTVDTVSARKLATELFDAIRAFRKQSEAEKEEVCRPLKTAWEEAKQPFDSFKKECEKWEGELQRKMSAWDTEQERLAKIEQAKLQAKIDKQNEKIIEKAAAKGIEPALKVAPVVQAPVKTVVTSAGTQQTRVSKTVYGIKGAVDNEDLTARDPRVKALLADYPDLFHFDWVKFRKVASTGMLDQYSLVESRQEYSYQQRGR